MATYCSKGDKFKDFTIKNTAIKTDVGTATGRGFSPLIWNDCPVSELIANPLAGKYFFDDFNKSCGASTVAGHDWYSYIDSGGSIISAADVNGVIQLKTDATDNDSTTIITGNNTSGLVTLTAGMDNKFWFETRVSWSTITNAHIASFVGLTPIGQAADTKPMVDDSTHEIVTTLAHIGWHIDGADGDGVNFVYNTTSGTAGSVADVHVPVANTYVKLGLKYDPATSYLYSFVNGVQHATAKILDTDASFPTAIPLAICFSIKADGSAANTDLMNIDWVRAAFK